MAKTLFFLLLISSLAGCTLVEKRKDKALTNDHHPENTPPILNEDLHIFYYNWYGNPQVDGKYYHWAHEVLKMHPGDKDPGSFPGGENIGANFYPEPGCYSSNDSASIDRHMQQIKSAGIGVVVLTWWGQQSFEDKNVLSYLNCAVRYGIKITFHLEPFPGRNPATVKQAIQYIIDAYGNHPAFYRARQYGNKPLFYFYDSYLIPAAAWAMILLKDSKNSLRGTPYDAVCIGLWVTEGDSDFFEHAGFDGFYTYFASEGFTYGSTLANWPHLRQWAQEHGKIFIPCVGPGYLDTRIRPWNERNTKSRENGNYYDRMFADAIHARASIIGLTSFNEWHEGTQIEPAIPKSINNFHYEDYAPLKPAYYLERTRYWSMQHLQEKVK